MKIDNSPIEPGKRKDSEWEAFKAGFGIGVAITVLVLGILSAVLFDAGVLQWVLK